jgi:hypothetical protein
MPSKDTTNPEPVYLGGFGNLDKEPEIQAVPPVEEDKDK